MGTVMTEWLPFRAVNANDSTFPDLTPQYQNTILRVVLDAFGDQILTLDGHDFTLHRGDSAATVKAAMVATGAVASGDITVTRVGGVDNYTFEFTGRYAGTPQAKMGVRPVVANTGVATETVVQAGGAPVNLGVSSVAAFPQVVDCLGWDYIEIETVTVGAGATIALLPFWWDYKDFLWSDYAAAAGTELVTYNAPGSYMDRFPVRGRYCFVQASAIASLTGNAVIRYRLLKEPSLALMEG